MAGCYRLACRTTRGFAETSYFDPATLVAATSCHGSLRAGSNGVVRQTRHPDHPEGATYGPDPFNHRGDARRVSAGRKLRRRERRWCRLVRHLDDIVEEGWDTYDDFPGNTAASRWRDVTDIDPADADYRWNYDGDLTAAELDELVEAFDDAVQAGRRHDGRAAVRAWEESLRDAC